MSRPDNVTAMHPVQPTEPLEPAGPGPFRGEYRFGPFRYEGQTGRLYKEGRDLGLAPRAGRLLECLLAQAGEVCEKDELMGAVWDSVAVGEESLTQAISVLRQALGDDSKRPVWLETIQRRGYRFIGEVERIDPIETGNAEEVDSAGLTRLVPWGIAAAALLVALAAVVWQVAGGPAAPGPGRSTPVRFSIDLGDNPLGVSWASVMALSPDGTQLALARRDGLYVRDLDSEELVQIAGTQRATAPFFTPDGSEVVFSLHGELKRVRTDGGPVENVVKARAHSGGTWAADGALLFARGPYGMLRLGPGSTEPEPLIDLDEGEGARSPQLLPGGEWLLFALNSGESNWNEAQIVVQHLPSGDRRVVARGSDPRFLPTGHIVYARNGSLWAVAFDTARLEPVGEPVVVVDELVHDPVSGASGYAISDTGVLVYLSGVLDQSTQRALLWVDREGTETLIDTRQFIDNPRLSPDGRSVVAVGASNSNLRVWVHELGRGWTLLTTDGPGSNPIWSHDGRTVFFSSTRDGEHGIWRRGVDFAGPEELVWQAPPGQSTAAESVSRDGRFLYFTTLQDGDADIWILDLDAAASTAIRARPIERLDTASAKEGSPKLHPSGRFLAYVSDESGQPEVYVHELIEPATIGRRWQISADGGDEPVWSRDGHAIYYRVDELLMEVDVETDGGFRASTPRLLLENVIAEPPGERIEYDIADDGRFLVTGVRGVDMALFSRVHVVVNWFAELQRRVDSAGR